MSSGGFLLRCSYHSATNIENDNLVRRFDPFKAPDSAKQIALAICGAEMVLATPTNVAKLSFVISMQDFIREAQPPPGGTCEDRRKYWARNSLGVQHVDVRYESPVLVVPTAFPNKWKWGLPSA